MPNVSGHLELVLITIYCTGRFKFDINLLQNMSFWISGVTTVIVSCIGVVGNVLSLVVLCKKVRREKKTKTKHSVLMFSQISSTIFLVPLSVFLGNVFDV